MDNTINNLSKDQLAKLLATEDIHVRRSVKAETASFDLKNRVLTLPILKEMSKDITDMMTGHEVAHALWTLPEEWFKAITEEEIHKQILNIVEDARIEKKIKRKYPGLTKSFITGYADLANRGFFGDTNPDDMPLIDRINLHAKMGFTGNIKFDPSEQWAVDAVAGVETFEEAKEVAKMLQMDYQESQQQDQDEFGDYADYNWNDDSDDEDETGSDFEELQSEDENESGATGSGGDISRDESGKPNPEEFDGSQTDDLMDDEFESESNFEKMKQSLNDSDSKEYSYFNLPKPILKNVLVSHKECDKIYSIMAKSRTAYGVGRDSNTPVYKNYIELTSADFNKFRNSSQKIINYMVKEFERKKAANEYRKISIAKTGIIDVNKLHSYKYNEDIFLKNAIMPDGKNHGMVMLLDWSASMTYNMDKTIQQLLNLVWFCQKVNIPFEVYAFSNSYSPAMASKIANDGGDFILNKDWLKYKADRFTSNVGEVEGMSTFNLLNFFSSRMSAKEMNRMTKALYAVGNACAKHYRNDYNLEEFAMGSTPLVEALVAMQTIIPNFVEKYKLHKCNLITLTDGDANTGFDGVIKDIAPEDRRMRRVNSLRSYGSQSVYTCPITRKSYKLDDQAPFRVHMYNAQVRLLVRLLRESHNVRTLGIFLDNDSAGKTIKRRSLEKWLGWYNYNKDLYAKVRKGAKKNGFATIPTKYCAYDEFYVVPSGTMQINDQGLTDVDENTSKGKLKTAFMKSQKGKFGSRILADRMMSLIA